MLRPEERLQFDIRMLMKEIGDVAKPMIDGGLIADQTDVSVAQDLIRLFK
jgi:hypothetical protein